MKTYTIIGGINGAGKSSLTGSLKYSMRDLGVIIDVDKLTAQQYGGDEFEGGQAAVAKIEQCIAEGVNFTQETTLSGGYPRKVAKAAQDAGYYIRLFYVGLDSLDESLSRIRNRVAKGGHDIPLKDVRRRFSRRFDSLKKILPYCSEAAFFDNRNGFIQVGEYRNGEIMQVGPYCPPWLRELIDNIKI